MFFVTKKLTHPVTPKNIKLEMYGYLTSTRRLDH